MTDFNIPAKRIKTNCNIFIEILYYDFNTH